MKLGTVFATSALFVGLAAPAFACMQTSMNDQGSRIVLAQATTTQKGQTSSSMPQKGSGEGGLREDNKQLGSGGSQKGSGEGGLREDNGQLGAGSAQKGSGEGGLREDNGALGAGTAQKSSGEGGIREDNGATTGTVNR
jgi:hypothetical protein